MTTREERQAHARVICQKVTAIINDMSPRGLGHWGRCWTLVSEASDRFLDSLDAWIREDSPEARETVETATEALLVGWEEAGAWYGLLTGAVGTQEVGHAHHV